MMNLVVKLILFLYPNSNQSISHEKPLFLPHHRIIRPESFPKIKETIRPGSYHPNTK